MVVVDSDLQLRKSAHTVSGITSLGGAITATVVTESVEDIFDTVTNEELTGSAVGEYECRCVYVYDNSPNNEPFGGLLIYIDQNTVAPFTDIDIGLDPAGINGTAQTIANENSIPSGVFFTFARGEHNAIFVGNVQKGQGVPLWIRRHAGPAPSGSSHPSDNYVLGFKVLKSGATAPPPTLPGDPIPPPPPDPGNDPFGVRKVYPDQTQGIGTTTSLPFYMNMTDILNDCRFHPQTTEVSRNADGSWQSRDTGARMQVFIGNVSGCNRDVIKDAVDGNLDTYNHDTWAERGYMWRPHDWKSVEMTMYAKVVDDGGTAADDSHLVLYYRGARHNSGVAGGCGGSAYKGVITADDTYHFNKEMFHNGEVECGDRSSKPSPWGPAGGKIGDFRGKWIGMKFMSWNYIEAATGEKSVHMEIWVDKGANNAWVKVGDQNDTGGWYPGAPDTSCPGGTWCGGTQDQILLWGSPIADIRWDNFNAVDFKWVSVREIVPPYSTL